MHIPSCDNEEKPKIARNATVIKTVEGPAEDCNIPKIAFDPKGKQIIDIAVG